MAPASNQTGGAKLSRDDGPRSKSAAGPKSILKTAPSPGLPALRPRVVGRRIRFADSSELPMHPEAPVPLQPRVGFYFGTWDTPRDSPPEPEPVASKGAALHTEWLA